MNLLPKLSPAIKIGLSIWLLSLSVRLYHFAHYQTMSQDQARDVTIAENYLQQGTWLIGYGPKASVGDFYLAPFYYYLQTIVQGLTNWPLAMGLVITMVESFTPVILWLIFWRWISKSGGVIVSCLYLVSPLVVTFAAAMWNPNMIPFFLTLGLWGTIEYVMTKRGWWIPIVGLAVTIAFHLHYQTAVVVLFYFLIYLMMLVKRWRDWPWFLLAVIVSLSTLLPYFIVEAGANWHNTQQIIHYFQTDHSRIYERVSKPLYIWLFLPQFFSRLLFPPIYEGWGIKVGRWLLLGVVPLISGWLVFKQLRHQRWQPKDQVTGLIIFYLLTVILMLRVYKGDKIDYYMSMLFLAPAVMVGLGWAYVEKTYRLIIYGLFLWVMFISGQWYGWRLGELHYSYYDLQEVFNFMNQVTLSGKVYPVVYHQELEWVWRYGVNHYSQMEMMNTESEADWIVQFCNANQLCEPFVDGICRGDSQIEKVGMAYDFAKPVTPVHRYRNGDFIVVVSKVVK